MDKRNIIEYIEAQEGMSENDRLNMDSFFLGYISSDVPRREWMKGIEYAKQKAQER